MDGLKRIQDAVQIVRRTKPVYAVPLLTMPFVASTSTEIMSTDGKVIRYNDSGCAKLPLTDICFVLQHEVLHKWGMHPRRSKELGASNHQIANIAADLAVNSLLIEQGESLPTSFTMCVPGVGKYSHLPIGESFEYYYTALFGERSKQEDPNAQTDGNKPSEDKQDEPGDDTDKQDDKPEDDNTGDGDDDSEGEDTATGDGQGTEDAAGEEDSGSAAAQTDDDDSPIANDVIPSGDQSELDNLKEVQAGIAAAESYGDQKSLATVKKLLGELTEKPKVDWKLRLRAYLTAASSKRKRSYSRESRRCSQFILPAYRRDKTLCKTFIVVDTSGSMNDYLYTILDECLGIVSAYSDASLTVVMCDTEIQGVHEVRNKQDIEVIRAKGMPGLGGTDMTPAFDYAVKHNAQLIVCLTDMCMMYPPRPAIPVVWGNLGRNGRVAGYGEVLEMKG
jgi:predicted metal-dependent peptidase